MFRNFFKTAWRNLIKHKTFSIINISGLAIGIAAFLLIISYLHFEYSYDDYDTNRDRLYRVPMEIAEKGATVSKPQTFAFTFPAVAPALKQDFPEIEEAIRFRMQWGVMKHGANKFVEDGLVYYVDPAVFKLFDFTFEKGDPHTALAGLNDAVITKSTAKKYFGDTDPIGQALSWGNEDYIVKAVIKDIPDNSHLTFHVLFNFSKYIQRTNNFGGETRNAWSWADYYTYLLLKPGTDVRALQAKLPAFAQRHMGDLMKQQGYVVSFNLQPLKDIHLKSKYNYEFPGNGNLVFLKYLGLAAFFILFIAWINYINLSTARALDRAKEVGVRKVIGAGKYQLIRQFLTESLLVNLLAIITGIAIYFWALPSFCRLLALSPADLTIPLLPLLAIIGTIFFSGGLLAGVYPSFILSSYSPLQALKQSVAGSITGSSKNMLRKSLVVIQFFAAIMLIAGAIAYYRQLRYMSTADLGINISQTLVLHQPVSLDSSKANRVISFVSDLEGHPGIQSVSLSSSIPGSEVGGSSYITTLHSKEQKLCRGYDIDNKFIRDYHLDILAGRGFTTDKRGPETNVILNQAAVRVLGFTSDDAAIGEKIKDGQSLYNIIGVLKDFHQKSLQSNIDPIVFYPAELYNMSEFSIRINTPDQKGMIDFIHRKWAGAFPDSPFSYNFLDDIFDAQYKSDRLFSLVLGLFAVLAIIVASLGLFGLSLYTITKRAKEISIRKVLGATVYQITQLIAKDYLRLILIAALPAIPVAWWVLNDWLNDYAFHISLGWWFVVSPIALILAVAMSTVIYHSLRAALNNPAKNLGRE
jgi:putative ABC transport system permease protein